MQIAISFNKRAAIIAVLQLKVHQIGLKDG
ncbi:hypothetical protein LA637_1777 [Erwinia amylovora LA637]|nr:hypothetical protein LA636_1775 [Erwinia amylovora LA636]CDK22137.1 hypothetical protein LA637_1777 [Erwinia amylovora LA637]